MGMRERSKVSRGHQCGNFPSRGPLTCERFEKSELTGSMRREGGRVYWVIRGGPGRSALPSNRILDTALAKEIHLNHECTRRNTNEGQFKNVAENFHQLVTVSRLR
jgi:hypothetical protein